MRGRTQRAGEPRPGRLVFALRSVVWPLEGAALPPTRGGRRGKEAAGALLGAEPPGPPGRCRHDAEPGRTPSGTGSGTSAVRFFRSLQSGPWAKSPRTTDLGLGPVARAAAGSGRFSKGFHFKAAHAGACRGPRRPEAGRRDRAARRHLPRALPGGRGWCPFPAPPARPWALPGVARSDPTWLAVALLPRDGRGARGVAPGGIGEVLSPRGVGRAGPPHPGACLRTLEPRPPPRAGPVSKTPMFPPSVRLSDPVTWWGAGAPRARRWP